MAAGAIALDIRDKEEHDIDHIAGSLHVSTGKLEMNVEGVIPDLMPRSCASATPTTAARCRRHTACDGLLPCKVYRQAT